MTDLVNAMRGALTLNISSLVGFRDKQGAFRRGVTVLVLVALVVGGISFLVEFIDRLVTPPEAELAQVTQSLEQVLQFMPPEAAQVFRDQFLVNFEAGFEISRRVEALPTPLPKVVGTFFESLSRCATATTGTRADATSGSAYSGAPPPRTERGCDLPLTEPSG